MLSLSLISKKNNIQKNRQRDKKQTFKIQTDKQTDNQANKQTNRKTNRKTNIRKQKTQTNKDTDTQTTNNQTNTKQWPSFLKYLSIACWHCQMANKSFFLRRTSFSFAGLKVLNYSSIIFLWERERERKQSICEWYSKKNYIPANWHFIDAHRGVRGKGGKHRPPPPPQSNSKDLSIKMQ